MPDAVGWMNAAMGFPSKNAVFGVGQTASVRAACNTEARKKAAGKKQTRASFIPPIKTGAVVIVPQKLRLPHLDLAIARQNQSRLSLSMFGNQKYGIF
jgi:hypothetical protein